MDRRYDEAIEPPIPAVWAGLERDQVVVLRGVSWEHYIALSDARNSTRPRMAYLDGELEVMSTSTRHEIWKTLIARLVETYAEESGTSLNGIGSATFRKEAQAVGVEPDECYCIGKMRRVPGLAIEVVYTSGGIDKLEVYRRLGVAEVWFWIEGRFWIYRKVKGKFVARSTSEALPGIDLDEVARIVITTDDSEQTEAIRAYRRALRRR